MPRRPKHNLQRHQGFSLVELLLVIVVLGIAAGSLTVVAARSTELSAAMLKEQQAFALANALLDEVVAMPFTACEPYPSSCLGIDVMGPDNANETRLGLTAATRFDNINDYNGFIAAGATLQDAKGNLLSATLPSMANCSVRINVIPQGLAGVAAGDALRIVVTVSACTGQINPVSVDAVRVRYAPLRWEF